MTCLPASRTSAGKISAGSRLSTCVRSPLVVRSPTDRTLLLGAVAALALLLHYRSAAAQRAPVEGARVVAGGTPAGVVVAFAGDKPPPGWLLCDGSVLGRAEHPALFAAIGTAHGGGGGAGSFNLPDYRGRFLRGVDHGASRDPDASRRTTASGGGSVGDSVGSVQGEQLGRHAHALYFTSVASHPGTSSANVLQGIGPSLDGPAAGSETRPVNAAVHWIVKE
jgi:microcystin-dependent protein